MVLTIAVWYRELPLLCTSPVLQPSLEPLATISHSIVSVFFIIFSHCLLLLIDETFSFFFFLLWLHRFFFLLLNNILLFGSTLFVLLFRLN